jgi:hypothetical protein
MVVIDWGSVADWFAACGTIGAVAVALYQAHRSSEDLRHQLLHQATVERARTEEQHLNAALAVIEDGYSEALIFGSYLESELGKYVSNVAYDPATLDRRKTAMRLLTRSYLDRRRAFDPRLRSSAEVLRALGRSTEAAAIAEVRRLAAVVFDEVTAKPESFIGEERVAATENARKLKSATAEASRILAARLADLYRAIYESDGNS